MARNMLFARERPTLPEIAAQSPTVVTLTEELDGRVCRAFGLSAEQMRALWRGRTSAYTDSQ